jgi:GTPase
MKDIIKQTDNKNERAIIVATAEKGYNRNIVIEHLNELESLANTAGAEIIEKIYQELEKPNPKTVLGKGKIEEIKQFIEDEDIHLVICDNDISPAQLRNLENSFNVKVIDRSGLILDIFAKHAKTTEAKTQVELAQSQYLLPRLTRLWTHLSKQYGGIRTKGPGETQIETDRRMLRLKIQRLKNKLKEISIQKEQQRKGRSTLPRFALVGYTNAGKSTLMNSITDSGVYVEDKLFATLDTTVRAFNFPNGQKALLSDTVGFIRKLPSHLVASFRSTLAEATDADILIHVIDIIHSCYHEHIKTVNETLENLKINDKPIILVFNKIDLIENINLLREVEGEYPEPVFISASRGINLRGLLEKIQEKYDEQGKLMEFILPYQQMSKINDIYTLGDIKERRDTDDGIYFRLRLKPEKAEYFNNLFFEHINKLK